MRTGGHYLGRKARKPKRRNCFDYEMDKITITSWDEWDVYELPDWAT